MQDLMWLDTHIGTIDDAVDLINKLHWDLAISETNGVWMVTTGGDKTVIFRADNRAALDAFLYGMALAYAGLPSPQFEQLAEEVSKWYANL
jgi:hypothetical protein